MFERIGFEKVRWNAGRKLDRGIEMDEWHISALLQKPRRRPTSCFMMKLGALQCHKPTPLFGFTNFSKKKTLFILIFSYSYYSPLSQNTFFSMNYSDFFGQSKRIQVAAYRISM